MSPKAANSEVLILQLGVLNRLSEGLEKLGARRQHERRLGTLPVTTQQFRSRHQLRSRHPENRSEGERKRRDNERAPFAGPLCTCHCRRSHSRHMRGQ
jgi:hypothetical protein